MTVSCVTYKGSGADLLKQMEKAMWKHAGEIRSLGGSNLLKWEEQRKDDENAEEKEVKPKKRIKLFGSDTGNAGDVNLA